MKAITPKPFHFPPHLENAYALSPPPSDRSPKIFVPFFCERDSMGRLLPSKKKETPCSPPPKSLLLPKLKYQKPEGLLTKIYKDSLVNPTSSRNNSIPSICEPSGSIVFQEKSWKSRNFSIGDNSKDSLGNYNIFVTPKKSQQKISQLQLQKIVSQQKENIIKAPETSVRTIKKLRTLASITNLGNVKSTKDLEVTQRKGSINNIEEEEGGETERTIKGGLSGCKSQPSIIKTERKKRIAIKKMVMLTEGDSGSPCVVKNIGRRDSAIKIVANNSYFKVIKTEDDKGKFLENQKAFQSSVVKMKNRINNLRTNIGENFVPVK